MKLIHAIAAALFAALFFPGITAAGQTPLPSADSLLTADQIIPKADSLRLAYDFAEAEKLCLLSLPMADSLVSDALREALVLSQNGLSMSDFCCQPSVVAKYRFPLEDFFLYYPMAAGSWRELPSRLRVPDGSGDEPEASDPASDPLTKAIFAPEGSEILYFAAPDSCGVRNLYRTALGDSLWSVPSLINESLTSPSDEVLPWISPDGKSLYFSSRGLYGMGGYDLYVSTWNEAARDWDAPVNLGFPFSSPYDDFLYINSDDGQYTVFASNRECPADSVVVYVLEFEALPLRKKVEVGEALRDLCALEPKSDRAGIDSGVQTKIQEDENVLKYMAAMDKVRAMRDSINACNESLDRMRARLKSDDSFDREALKSTILVQETSIPGMQRKLNEALKDLMQIEMDFLASGIVIDPDRLRAEANREVVSASSSFVFSRSEYGAPLELRIEEPEPQSEEPATLPPGFED